jgi:hypothetical protein
MDQEEWLRMLVQLTCIPSMIQELNQIHQRVLLKMDNDEKVLLIKGNSRQNLKTYEQLKQLHWQLFSVG